MDFETNGEMWKSKRSFKDSGDQFNKQAIKRSRNVDVHSHGTIGSSSQNPRLQLNIPNYLLPDLDGIPYLTHPTLL